MEATQLHQQCIVFDAHCDTILDVLEGKRTLEQRSSEGHLDLPRLREGGVTAQIFAIYVRREYHGRSAHQTLRCLDALHSIFDRSTDDVIMATTAADVERAKADGKIAAIIAIEGAEALEGELALLRVYHRLGVRNVGITWSLRNRAADGVFEARTGGGLTNFGVELVEEMNRLGIMIDVAHLAPAGVRDVLEISQAPVIASHANAHALRSVARNLTDQQLERIASTGGVVGVTFVPYFLDEDWKQASLGHLVDHIDHIVKVAGIDHVGLGSDFDGFPPPPPTGLEDATCFPHITTGLLERGYGDDDVRKILGGNFMRVFRQVCG